MLTLLFVWCGLFILFCLGLLCDRPYFFVWRGLFILFCLGLLCDEPHFLEGHPLGEERGKGGFHEIILGLL